MTWARFDDNYDSNPKIIAAGLLGKSLHESSIRWSCRSRTYGRIPKDALLQIATLAQLPENKTIRLKTAILLVELNLWEDSDDGWIIHDFQDFAPPQRFVKPAERITKNHAARDYNHAPRDPDPTRPVPVVSLEELQAKALRRGVASEGLSSRLEGLKQQVEGKARNWVAYVQGAPEGRACLFDQAVSRWLEEDHAARKAAEREAPDLIPLRLKRMEEA